LALLIFLLIALSTFVVATISLLLRNRSGLAAFASLFIWPYWFVFGISTLDRFFWQPPFYRLIYFLGFASPILFAFAAGIVPYHSKFAHWMAILAGTWSALWIYRTDLRNIELQNAWIMFNVPTKEVGMYPVLHAKFTILAVALIVLAIATALLRLIPHGWTLRNGPVCERTWPAYAASFLVLAIWYGQSVMPYRIPGALDYSDRPILQILHVEKRGLQFHEMSISIGGRGPVTFSTSRNDRRLFQYSFKQMRSSGDVPEPLMRQVWALVQSPDFVNKKSEIINPLRARNAEGWYAKSQSSGFHAYTTESGTKPPPEVVSLFHDLEATPKSPETQSDDINDVCLGFCYDPLSGLGLLYSNHRCFNAGHGTFCS
jgi:hypothetical protein